MSEPTAAESTAAGSLAYADEWVDRLRTQLPRVPQTWDAEAIHHSRVATRRLRAAVAVVEPILSKRHARRLTRPLKRLRRRLGPLRDLDVMLDHLAELPPTAGREWFRAQLDADRTRCRADGFDPTRSLAKLDDAWAAARADWAEAGDAVDPLLANAVHLQLDAFAERATGPASGDPHELRIAGKALRYTLELAVAAGHPLPESVARSFKRMQDALGAWHDEVVLAERAVRAALDAQLAYHEPALYLSVSDLARAAVQRSQKHLAAFTTLWRKQGEAIAGTIRDALPVAHAVDGS